MKHAISIFLFIFSISLSAQEAKLKFADILADNMVLQRDRDLNCWGQATAGSSIEIIFTQSREDVLAFIGEAALEREEKAAPKANDSNAIGKVRLAYVQEDPALFKTVRKTVTADKDGRWDVKLGKYKATYTPIYLAAKSGEEKIAIKNLLIGEVWIASGQSNMAWGNTRDKMWENEGLLYNGLRYIRVNGDRYEPSDNYGGKIRKWDVCEDGTARQMSSVPYLFGHYLHRRLKVPVGIINIAVGGTYAREWSDRDLLKKLDSPTLNKKIQDHDNKIKEKPEARDSRGPASLFNGSFYPLRHLDVAGVIYLQGENEALTGDLPQYVKTFPAVIQSFRQAMDRPDLPFGIITLQGMGDSDGYGFNSYSVAREIHLKTHEVTPNTGYIVAHDIGGGIHPNYKRPLATRAVYWALRDIYGVYPKAQKIRIKSVNFNENKAVIDFASYQLKDGKWVEGKKPGLHTNDQNSISGFMIAGADRNWFPGQVSGTPGEQNSLTITHPMVDKPVALRYAWEGWSKANLGHWHDPVPPYRSDDWPVLSPDILTHNDGKSPAELRYKRGEEKRNRKFDLPLQTAIAQADINLLKRHKHHKAMFISMLDSMDAILNHFEAEKFAKRIPKLRIQALHTIPARYWRRDRYSPARRAKWGWLIESVLRFETLPEEMQATFEKPEIKSGIADLRKAIDNLKKEFGKLPDPEAMTFDQMLDKILVIMAAEKEKLLKEGVNLGELERDMRRRSF